ITVSRPTSVYPRFVRARQLNVRSNPNGLQVVVDRTTVKTPHKIDWGRGTTHTLGVVRDQLDVMGKLWVWDSWSDGGAETHAYTMPEGILPLEVTANFIKGIRTSFITSPPGLRLSVDGRSNWQGYNFNWGVGTQHTVSAPNSQQFEGRTYVFKGWSNGGNATQTLTIPDTGELGFTLVATFEPQAQVTIQSLISNATLDVDGQNCALPCTINRQIGASVRLSAPASIPVNENSRLDFAGWGDSGLPDRVIVLPAEALQLNLNYALFNRLLVTANEPQGVLFRTNPQSADGFFAATTQVQVTAELQGGYRLNNWEGDATGVSRFQNVNMASPRVLRAVLERVPHIFPGGIRNAAGETPDNAVAAGSIASIFGFNLSGDYQKGPDGPLVQALAGVTVRANNRLLPMFFASPDQINVQLPSDLPEGAQVLYVRREGKPEISGEFNVVRNAPGLFNQNLDGKNYVLALHENGEAVTPLSPARRGENVTILGTGFGPYLQMAPDGFPLPESPNFVLADALELRINDNVVVTGYAGAATGRVGMQAVRFRVAEDWPSGPLNLNVRVNDRPSNNVLLPVE
ncbi:MAG: InlB B-repeat-containing protein, partial [Bryobacteraceae bacterium]